MNFLWLLRNDISHGVVYDDQKLGMCALSRPQGQPLTTDILKTDESIQSETKSLQTESTLDNGKN